MNYRDEGDVKKEVKRLLTKHKWTWWMPAANAYGQAGASDFHALRNGQFMAIETKFGTRKTTAMQDKFLANIRAQDGFAFVVSDRRMDYFTQWLEAFDKSIEAVQKRQPIEHSDGAAMLNAIHALTGGVL